MSVRSRYARLDPQIVSAAQIAEAADVTAQAVSNWIARWEDFPAPLARFGNADVYPRDEVTDCLLRHGRSITWKEAS